VLFVTPREQRMMREIERFTRQRIEAMPIPARADVTVGSDNVPGLWVLPPCGGRPRHVTDRRYVERQDGTVTIEGVLLFDGWEGFLERGVWRRASKEVP
jgi:hypothetical protein